MSRYTGPSCRQCRREGTKLFLKGTKCFTEKCPVERRPYAPGQHGQSTARRKKMSEYAKQLREKQKIKRQYGVSEKQFRNTFDKVSSQQGLRGPTFSQHWRRVSKRHIPTWVSRLHARRRVSYSHPISKSSRTSTCVV